MSAIKKLTGMGSDVRQIAKLLQAKAPPGHKLAFISEEEAALLKSRGGSGRITPEGIPSYEETYYSEPTSVQGMQPVSEAAPVTAPAQTGSTYYTDPTSAQGQAPVASTPSPATSDTSPYSFSANTGANPPASSDSLRIPSYNESLALPSSLQAPALGSLPATPSATAAPAIQPAYSFNAPPSSTDVGAAAVSPTAPTDKSFYDKTLEALGQPKTLAALGIGGVQAALGANAVRKAQQDAAKAKEQLQSMAAPYQQQGQQLQQLAQQGQLTPANQQTLQAARAQLAQGAEARGGVGAAQAATQIANLTQNLLSQQMNLGIQLQGMGDKIAQGAIQTGIQADQYINQLTSNYAQNIARTVAGGVGLPGQSTTITVPSGG